MQEAVYDAVSSNSVMCVRRVKWWLGYASTDGPAFGGGWLIFLSGGNAHDFPLKLFFFSVVFLRSQTLKPKTQGRILAFV